MWLISTTYYKYGNNPLNNILFSSKVFRVVDGMMTMLPPSFYSLYYSDHTCKWSVYGLNPYIPIITARNVITLLICIIFLLRCFQLLLYYVLLLRRISIPTMTKISILEQIPIGIISRLPIKSLTYRLFGNLHQ